MDKFKIIMMSGQTYLVNKSEYQGIMKTEKGMFLPRLEVFINKSSISTAYPESRTDEVEDRKSLTTGILHDGTRVRKHFGQWIDARQEVPDDNGNYKPIRLDTTYYPEIALDRVFTEREYEEVKQLNTEEKLDLLIGGDERVERIGKESGFDSIGDVVNKKQYVK